MWRYVWCQASAACYWAALNVHVHAAENWWTFDVAWRNWLDVGLPITVVSWSIKLYHFVFIIRVTSPSCAVFSRTAMEIWYARMLHRKDKRKRKVVCYPRTEWWFRERDEMSELRGMVYMMKRRDREHAKQMSIEEKLLSHVTLKGQEDR